MIFIYIISSWVLCHIFWYGVIWGLKSSYKDNFKKMGIAGHLLIAIVLSFLICAQAFAQPPDFVYDRPNIPIDKILNEQEQKQVKDALTKQGRKLISKYLTPAKNDYNDDFDRGTVCFNSKKGLNKYKEEVFEASNYSYHKVLIPNGTTIHRVNFSQTKFDTDTIEGENLTFRNCNLTNVLLRPSWTLISCNTTQIKQEIIGNELITYNRDKQGKWIEVEREIIS